MPITEKQRLYNRQWYETHREEAKAKALAKYHENLSRYKEYARIYHQTHKQKLNEKSRVRRQKLKIEIITYYGNGKLACIICGFSDIRALTIDHIDGGGFKDRKTGKARLGGSFYRQLRDEGYPQGYQTLCMNCQFIKRYEGKEYGKDNISNEGRNKC